MSVPVHLVNPMRSAFGGSEWRTVQIFELLAPHCDVTIWSAENPDPTLLGRVPIRRLDPRVGAFPKSGNVVIIGTYFNIRDWIGLAKPNRIVIIYNLNEPASLHSQIEVASLPGGPRPEVVYASDEVRLRAEGPPGEVHASPIDLSRFQPAERTERPFTIGRVSRDVAFKHHPDDPALYAALASKGMQVRLLGGTVLADALKDLPSVETLPVGSEPVEEFLQTLDCFYYRTDPNWYEASGRVILEAMACGLPIVAEARHGYHEYTDDSQLFQSPEEAMEKIVRLSQSPEAWQIAREISLEFARRAVNPEVEQRLIEYYTRV